MKIDESIFKAYDVRGIYGETIDDEIAFKIGIAFVNHFKLKNVAIGRDGRISSPSLYKAFSKGVMEAGANVVNIGIVSSDMIYFASGFYKDIDGAMMITASHNPKEYNGVKFCLKNAFPVSGDEGIYQMRDMVANDQLRTGEVKGRETKRDVFPDFAQKMLSVIDSKTIRPLKIVVDAGNGIGGHVLDRVYKDLPIEIIPLYFEIDGNFPNHQPSPIEEKNIADLKKKVISEKADFGMAFDGDGDRVYFVDDRGKGISATETAAMISKKMLERYPKSKILYNLICGWIVPETIRKYGGSAYKTRVGHSFIKAKMRSEDAVFAAEHSGHYFFKDLYCADSGMMASLIVLELVSKQNVPLSKIVKDFDKYFMSGEINTKFINPKEKIAELKKKYDDGKTSELDGLSVEYTDWRFNVRPSNTEPLLRLNVEAKTEELMKEERDSLLRIIRQ